VPDFSVSGLNRIVALLLAKMFALKTASCDVFSTTTDLYRRYPVATVQISGRRAIETQSDRRRNNGR
jgi:hypothetical protein